MQSSKKLWFLLILVLLFHSGIGQTTHAQDSFTTKTFAWRGAGLIMQYPAHWLQGEYEGHPVLASTPDALEKAHNGEAPGAPALTFLHYPQAGVIAPADLLLLVFPNQTITPMVMGGLDGMSMQFEDAGTGQTIWAAAFKSPLVSQSHLVVAAAPTEAWAEFEPQLLTMVASIQFLAETASLEFAGGLITFNYPEAWHAASNGQVLVVSGDQAQSEAILEGNLTDAPPFIRAQLLVPSGIGVDPTDPQAPRQILELFTGQAPTDVAEFEWGDGLPAVLTLMEVEGINLLLVVVVDGDHALLMGGGAAVEAWPTARVWIDGSLHLTVYNEQIAPLTLENIIAGDDGPFGMAQ